MAIPGKILNPASYWNTHMQTSHFSRSHSSCIHSGQHGSCTYITTDMHEYRKLSAERLGGQIGCGSAAGSAAAADRGEWSGSGSGHAHTATMGAPMRRMSMSRAPRSRRNPAKGRASSAASILRRIPNVALVATACGSQRLCTCSVQLIECSRVRAWSVSRRLVVQLICYGWDISVVQLYTWSAS